CRTAVIGWSNGLGLENCQSVRKFCSIVRFQRFKLQWLRRSVVAHPCWCSRKIAKDFFELSKALQHPRMLFSARAGLRFFGGILRWLTPALARHPQVTILLQFLDRGVPDILADQPVKSVLDDVPGLIGPAKDVLVTAIGRVERCVLRWILEVLEEPLLDCLDRLMIRQLVKCRRIRNRVMLNLVEGVEP